MGFIQLPLGPFAISEINENVDNFLIDEKVADTITENLKIILRKVYQNN
ncbi:hypothetical protein [Streptococcus equi]|nr:hypothetical protein [Streptococcus equi]QBX15466.1 hypothetical protein Javan187_0030 [Streptococcus phage Javan187]HEK9479809.1 hypothetical protein [Streptococcus equi subsp. equi]HEK9489407.1 hypothetical protein [Streptococcus equi subsp. equi]